MSISPSACLLVEDDEEDYLLTRKLLVGNEPDRASR